ncbi:MAG: hypothetical protein QN120_09360 [Armatimonadota bacterium]|nr:hypothetical protein [Armatimonadota bacterium]
MRILKPGGRLVLYTDNLPHVRLRVAIRALQSRLMPWRTMGQWRVGFSGYPGGHVALVSPQRLCRLVNAAGCRARVVYSMPEAPVLGMLISRYFCVIGEKAADGVGAEAGSL